jgi:spore coat-associated protein N
MKKRMATALLASTVAFAGLVGAGTYAYFSDTESSAGNTIQVGKLEMTGFRNDIPIEGPMFYTNNDVGPGGGRDGVLGTGFWKPGDVHTRAMFIQNTGNLNAKLYHLSAAPQGNKYWAEEFAKQSTVTISVVEPDADVFLNIDSSEYADLVQAIDTFYKTEFKRLMKIYFPNPKDRREMEEAIKTVHGWVKQAIINRTFKVDVDGDPVNVHVKHVFQDKLINLINNTSNVAADLQYTVEPGKALFFGYTVMFDESTPEINNPLQGKEVKFKFSTEFRQQ